MNKPLWLDFFEGYLDAGLPWEEAADKADQAVADHDAAFVNAAVDAAKDGGWE